MKKFLRIPCIAILMVASIKSNAQCSTVTLNWDYLDYFSYTANYTSVNGYLSSNTLSRNQRFAFGTQSITIVHNYADANELGENTANTGEAGSYGTGADIQYVGNGSVTFTFDNPVQNVKFSIYDIDLNQKIVVSSVGGSISVAKISGSVLSIGGGGTTATANNTVVGATSTDGTINVDITGTVTSFTITVTNTVTNASEDGSFWVSDISACSPGSFPNNYYNVSKPFTGQAAYVLTALDKSVYAVNTATGFSRLLFTDNTSPFGGSSFINSMAYDPYKRIIYYVYSLTSTPGTNRMLKKFDFNTGTIGTVLSDISSATYGTGVNIPVVTQTGGNSAYGAGVESGAAAFYNGSLFLGIETSNRNSGGTLGTSNREAVIWRIDFDVSNVPYRASQVFALPVDNGSGTLTHDWADFGINDGILYDFDGAGVTTQTDVYQMNMLTGSVTNYSNSVLQTNGWTPGQISTGWDGKIYQLYAYNTGGTSSDEPAQIALYNGNGTIGTATNLSAIPAIAFPNPPSLGDAGEAIRFPVDFGDAPSTFDPSGSDPAVHEISSNLYLGANKDSEFVTRGQTVLANSDNYDDGLPTVNIFNPNYHNYLTSVNVFNNTGTNATICAWLDYNGNGIFDVTEGITVTVPNSGTTQSVYLYWPSISSVLSMGTYTYLRIRVTSASNGMTISNSTGYFNNGEVEDYRVPVNTFALNIQLLAFDAQKTNDKKVNLRWQVAGEQIGVKYELQRSSDMQNWTSIQNILVSSVGSNYIYTDSKPLPGFSFYRLKIVDVDGSITYSQTKKIEFEDISFLAFAPNPAISVVTLTIGSEKITSAHLCVTDMNGRLVRKQILTLQQGTNTIRLPFVEKLNAGIYLMKIEVNNKTYTNKLMKK